MNNELTLLALAASLVATLFGLLVMVLGWLGSKVIQRLDTLADKLDVVSGELHTRINGLDSRLTKVETRCETNHRQP